MDRDGSGGDNPLSCPTCESNDVEAVTVLEHATCGCTRPVGMFLTTQGLECPECEGDGPILAVGVFYRCDFCGGQFDRHDVARRWSTDGATEAEGTTRETTRRSDSTATRTAEKGTSLTRKLLTVGIVLAVVLAGTGIAFASPQLFPNSSDAQPTTHWTTYQSIVVFRNDDIQKGYRTATMRTVDTLFIQEGIPVTEGVIPAINDHGVAENSTLCQYLRRREANHPDVFQYALHGYNHRLNTHFHGGSEFAGLTYEAQHERLKKAQAIFKRCLGHRTRTFIPPFDTYDNATVRALNAEGFDVVSGGGWFTGDYYGTTSPFEYGGLVHVPNSHAFVKNWSTDQTFTTAELEHAFDRAYRNGSLYVQMIHYPQFKNETHRKQLRALIQHMKSRENVTFMTVGEVGRGLANGSIERVDTGWRVRETAPGGGTNRAPFGGHLPSGWHLPHLPKSWRLLRIPDEWNASRLTIGYPRSVSQAWQAPPAQSVNTRSEGVVDDG